MIQPAHLKWGKRSTYYEEEIKKKADLLDCGFDGKQQDEGEEDEEEV